MFSALSNSTRFVHELLKSFVYWLDQKRVLSWLQGVLAMVMFAIPTAADFELVDDSRWYIGAVVSAIVFVVLELYESFVDGTALDRVTRRLADVHGSLAGGIDSVRSDLLCSKGRKLSHDQCKHICTGLLHRIRDYTAIAYEIDEKPRLRASLLVPLRNVQTGQVDALRVWCYDQSHQDRGSTTIPLERNGNVVAGGPRAYLHNEIDLLPDVHKVVEEIGVPKRRYRSVVSFPLEARDASTGRPIAVVSIDADQVDFFDPHTTLEKLHPLIAPALNMMGLVLELRNKGQGYVFPV